MTYQTYAATFNGYDNELHIDAAPNLAPAAGEVLIKVATAAVNHMDAFVRHGDFKDAINLTFPARSGTCFAGIITAVGHGVTGFKRGDEVLGHDPQHGAHATHIVVPAGVLVKKPAKLSFEVAGSLYLAGVTALSTINTLGLKPGDCVIISAAAGGVGHIEAQLAHLAGATVIGIAGKENHDYLRSIGIKPVAYGPDLQADIKKLIPTDANLAFIDNYGAYTAMAEELGVPNHRIRTSDDRRKLEIRFYNATDTDREATTLLADIVELVTSWHIRVLISGFYPFENLETAFEDLKAKHSRGKVIVGMKPAATPANYLGTRMRAHYEHREPALVP